MGGALFVVSCVLLSFRGCCYVYCVERIIVILYLVPGICLLPPGCLFFSVFFRDHGLDFYRHHLVVFAHISFTIVFVGPRSMTPIAHVRVKRAVTAGSAEHAAVAAKQKKGGLDNILAAIDGPKTISTVSSFAV